MAIQQINLGSMPLGAGGDTQRAANTKINANFTNTQHAASRLVGENAGEVMEVGAFGVGFKNNSGYSGKKLIPDGYASEGTEGSKKLIKELPVGFFKTVDVGEGFTLGSTLASPANEAGCFVFAASSVFRTAPQYCYIDASKPLKQFEQMRHTFYTTQNTILENGYLKPSSPVLRLKHDGFVKEHEAEQLDIKASNPEKGVYIITGTTGLRKNDGWFFSPPKDEHFNVLCMVEIEEKDDVITVKTYKKKFDFEKVAIVPDYDQPIDIIGEVLLRFNDLPVKGPSEV